MSQNLLKIVWQERETSTKANNIFTGRADCQKSKSTRSQTTVGSTTAKIVTRRSHNKQLEGEWIWPHYEIVLESYLLRSKEKSSKTATRTSCTTILWSTAVQWYKIYEFFTNDILDNKWQVRNAQPSMPQNLWSDRKLKITGKSTETNVRTTYWTSALRDPSQRRRRPPWRPKTRRAAHSSGISTCSSFGRWSLPERCTWRNSSGDGDPALLQKALGISLCGGTTLAWRHWHISTYLVRHFVWDQHVQQNQYLTLKPHIKCSISRQLHQHGTGFKSTVPSLPTPSRQGEKRIPGGDLSLLRI